MRWRCFDKKKALSLSSTEITFELESALLSFTEHFVKKKRIRKVIAVVWRKMEYSEGLNKERKKTQEVFNDDMDNDCFFLLLDPLEI